MNKQKFNFFFCIIICLGILARYYYLDHVTHDVSAAFVPWFNQLKVNGGFRALAFNVGDYNLPYMTILAATTYLPFKAFYLVKAIPLFFDSVMITAFYKIACHYFQENEKRLLILLILVLEPLTIWDGAAWGQCDVVYSSFLAWMMYFILKEKWINTFVCFGLAISFKLQAIFSLPFLLFLYLKKGSFPITYFFIVPLLYVLTSVPAFIAGKPLNSLYSVYGNQVNMFSNMSIWYPNIYYIMGVPYDHNFYGLYSKYFILLTMLILATGLVYQLLKKQNFDFVKLLEIDIWCIWTSCMFLPGMHERYSFFMNIAIVLYCFLIQKYGIMALMLEMITMLSYLPFLFFDEAHSINLFVIMSLFNLLLYVLFSYYIFSQKIDGEIAK